MPDDNAPIEELEQDPASTEGFQDASGEQDISQPGQPEVDWQSKFSQVLEHNKALNRALVDARRQSNSQRENPYTVEDEGTASYQQNLKLATADIRDGIEKLLPLYPELPAEVVSQIRRNPLAYAGGEFFGSLNVPNALIDIETHMYNLVESVGTQQPQQAAPQQQPMKQVRPSRAPVGEEEDLSGEPSKEDLWTMPMADLEKEVRKVRSKQN